MDRAGRKPDAEINPPGTGDKRFRNERPLSLWRTKPLFKEQSYLARPMGYLHGVLIIAADFGCVVKRVVVCGVRIQACSGFRNVVGCLPSCPSFEFFPASSSASLLGVLPQGVLHVKRIDHILHQS